jgi:hypothetical protein
MGVLDKNTSILSTLQKVSKSSTLFDPKAIPYNINTYGRQWVSILVLVGHNVWELWKNIIIKNIL